MDTDFHPFIIFVCLALLTEIISTAAIYLYRSNVIVLNIYIIVEFNVLLLLFRKWRTITRQGFNRMLVFSWIIWSIDNLVINNLYRFNSISDVMNALIILYLSIDTLNHVVGGTKNVLSRDSKFLICLGLIIYFTYIGLLEAFNIFHRYFSDAFINQLFDVLTFINFIINLLYAYAALWIPKKLKYLFQ